MADGVYVYPKLPAKARLGIRFIGPGLANSLFVYARALILARKYQAALLSPEWVQVNVGPYLRRQADKRHYSGLFKASGIGGVRKQWILLTRQSRRENAGPHPEGPGVVIVEGLGRYFEDLHGHSSLVRGALLDILRPEWQARLHEVERPSIGVHVRLGDYAADSRMPLEWYVRMVALLREQFGRNVPCLVFSDGSRAELSALLQQPDAHYVNFGSAISDMLALARTSVIVASDSTFSAWGAYLGQVPVLFRMRHFGPVLDTPAHECVQGTEDIELVRSWAGRLTLRHK